LQVGRCAGLEKNGLKERQRRQKEDVEVVGGRSEKGAGPYRVEAGRGRPREQQTAGGADAGDYGDDVAGHSSLAPVEKFGLGVDHGPGGAGHGRGRPHEL
jgi:hypothetical protein